VCTRWLCVAGASFSPGLLFLPVLCLFLRAEMGTWKGRMKGGEMGQCWSSSLHCGSRCSNSLNIPPQPLLWKHYQRSSNNPIFAHLHCVTFGTFPTVLDLAHTYIHTIKNFHPLDQRSGQ